MRDLGKSEPVADSGSAELVPVSLAELDFKRYPVPKVAALSMWLVMRGVGEEEAVTRLRATGVSAASMRAAAALVMNGPQESHRHRSVQRLLLAAAQPLPPSSGATVS